MTDTEYPDKWPYEKGEPRPILTTEWLRWLRDNSLGGTGTALWVHDSEFVDILVTALLAERGIEPMPPALARLADA